MADDGETVVDRWKAWSLGAQFVSIIVAGILPIVSAAAIGWAAGVELSSQASLPPRVTALEDSVYGQRLTTRLDHIEETVENRTDRLDSISSKLGALNSVANRILCHLETPNEPCIRPGRGGGD